MHFWCVRVLRKKREIGQLIVSGLTEVVGTERDSKWIPYNVPQEVNFQTSFWLCTFQVLSFSSIDILLVARLCQTHLHSNVDYGSTVWYHRLYKLPQKVTGEAPETISKIAMWTTVPIHGWDSHIQCRVKHIHTQLPPHKIECTSAPTGQSWGKNPRGRGGDLT